MSTDSGCKGCTASVNLSEEELAVLRQLALHNEKLVTEEEYARRIEICRSCQALQYGTTCRYCGCLVEIKAKLESSRCPDPAGRRW